MRLKASTVRLGATGEHLAERCRDDYCHRLPCVLFKAGYDKGLADGYAAGYAAGYTAGYSGGYAAGDG